MSNVVVSNTIHDVVLPNDILCVLALYDWCIYRALALANSTLWGLLRRVNKRELFHGWLNAYQCAHYHRLNYYICFQHTVCSSFEVVNVYKGSKLIKDYIWQRYGDYITILRIRRTFACVSGQYMESIEFSSGEIARTRHIGEKLIKSEYCRGLAHYISSDIGIGFDMYTLAKGKKPNWIIQHPKFVFGV